MSLKNQACEYIGFCLKHNDRDVLRMKVFGREISAVTFKDRCAGVKDFANAMGFNTIAELQNYRGVKFFRSKFQGRRCYYVRVDGVKYIWCKEQ
jgi:hypothetical protein